MATHLRQFCLFNRYGHGVGFPSNDPGELAAKAIRNHPKEYLELWEVDGEMPRLVQVKRWATFD